MSIDRPPARPRVRRSPEAARDNILAAAESLLVERGPQALKLADVAARAGVANASVLHHFGSIDEVQTALMERMVRQLVDQILAAPPVEGGAAGRAEAGARALFDAFETRGAARLAAWMELTGQAPRMTLVRGAIQEVVAGRIASGLVNAEQAEDFILVCVALAMGVGLFGASLDDLMGKPPGRTRQLAQAMIRTQLAAVAGDDPVFRPPASAPPAGRNR
ncbi:MAG: TetR/AcrR family transcriptional regulator [Pseudomonadota bacterium]